MKLIHRLAYLGIAVMYALTATGVDKAVAYSALAALYLALAAVC